GEDASLTVRSWPSARSSSSSARRWPRSPTESGRRQRMSSFHDFWVRPTSQCAAAAGWNLPGRDPAVYGEDDAVDVRAGPAGQEDRDPGHVVGPPDTAER